jgi:hypothetical protein
MREACGLGPGGPDIAPHGPRRRRCCQSCCPGGGDSGARAGQLGDAGREEGPQDQQGAFTSATQACLCCPERATNAARHRGDPRAARASGGPRAARANSTASSCADVDAATPAAAAAAAAAAAVTSAATTVPPRSAASAAYAPSASSAGPGGFSAQPRTGSHPISVLYSLPRIKSIIPVRSPLALSFLFHFHVRTGYSFVCTGYSFCYNRV